MNRNSHRIFKLGVGAVSTLVFGATSTLARAEESATQPVALEEIVVTATKRKERIEDVPIAISALSGARLEQLGAENFQDFARTVPGISFVDIGPSHNKIVIRGIATSVAWENAATTSVYIDEVPVGSSASNPDLKLFDIERVEVLRGPQGTLYGDAAMGGTVRYVTAKADPSAFAARAEGAFSSTSHAGSNWEASAMVNLPLVENKLAVRLVGYHRDLSGFIDNVNLGVDDVNGEETTGGRMSARWLANDDLTLTLNIIHQDSKHDGRNTFLPSVGDLQQGYQLPEPLNDRLTITNLTAEVNLDWATLDSSTSYLKRSLVERRDWSAAFAQPTALDDLGKPSSIVQETRLASNADGRVTWIIGTYVAKDDAGLPQRVLAYTPTGVDVLLDVPEVSVEAMQLAAFGEIGYKLTDRLTVTGGLRWYDIEQDVYLVVSGPFAGLAPGEVAESRSSAEHDGFIPKFALSYELNDTDRIYFQAAKGFRQGGPTGEGFPPDLDGTPAPTQFGPDSLWNYEIGAKTAWLDGRLTANAAVFYIDWKDLQTTVARLDNRFYTTNAGTATSKGAEIEIAARLFDGLDLAVAGAWIDAALEEDQPFPNNGLAGMRMPGVPKKTFSTSARYSFPLGAGWDAFVQGAYQYVGDSINGFQTAFASGSPADLQPAYDLTSLRAGVHTQRYEIELFADNVFDERPALFIDRVMGDVRYHTARPRTIGVALKSNF